MLLQMDYLLHDGVVFHPSIEENLVYDPLIQQTVAMSQAYRTNQEKCAHELECEIGVDVDDWCGENYRHSSFREGRYHLLQQQHHSCLPKRASHS